MNRVRFRSYVRPLFFLLLLGSSLFIFVKLFSLTNKLESNIVSESNEVRGKIFSDIHHSEKFFIPLNSSATNLARILSSSLNGKQITFSVIRRKVAPTLFIFLSTIPYVSEVSYTRLDGLSFWYYRSDDQILAVFSNTTTPLVTYYSQKVNRDTGKLYGEAIALNSSYKFNHSSLGMGLNPNTLLFKSTIPVNGKGLISVGSKAQVIIDLFSSLDFLDGYFQLASNDGRELIGTKLPNTRIVVNNGTLSIRTIDQKVVNYPCNVDGNKLGRFSLKINGKGYIFYCSTMEYGGVKLVYSLAFPRKGMERVARNMTNLAIILLGILLAIIVISLFVFFLLIWKAARRQMFLCAALIKQMESTQQAERKSMNKSMAFANASHDVRGSLAAITGLIEVCREEVNINSELASNLTQIQTCATDVLGILNSVLDISKIEAGKMQLEVEEFDLGEVLDEVVDMYYPLGFKKGVDVIHDPGDGSIMKFYHVKGDRGKFKQILCNLVSNAIKFTSEGHIVVRTAVRKPCKENAIIASNHNSSSVLNRLTRLCYKANGTFNSLDELHPVQEDPKCMEFMFHVEDTGIGIPKEKQKSVFENFVQVKETAFGQEGCGLGLGIVQSLVRLMGGEIQIVDKEHGEKGSCFRFNIFLTCTADSTDIEEQGNHMHNSRSFGHLRSPTSRSEGSHVILLLAGEERRKISRRVIESFGINVSVAKRSKDLSCILEKIKTKMVDSLHCSSPELSPGHYPFAHSNLAANEGTSSSTWNGSDRTISPCKKQHSRRTVNFLLIIMDANAGLATELFSIVSSFIQETPSIRSKVVWLENPITRGDNSRVTREKISSLPCDYIMSKPLHGSRLYQIIGLLPEFANDPLIVKASTLPAQENQHGNEQQHKGTTSMGQKEQLEEIIIVHENTDDKTSKKPLEGKSVLVVEDTAILSKIASNTLQSLGAKKVDVCVNGKEAVDLVCKLLRDQKVVNQQTLPFDFIFMDCQMPVMSGYEAARCIRMEEKRYGIHIPIFALTAEATSKAIDAGMDYYLSKPLKVDELLDAIRLVCS